jgi:hypothetical protein
VSTEDEERDFARDLDDTLTILQTCEVMHPNKDWHVDGCQGMAQLQAARKFYGVTDR